MTYLKTVLAASFLMIAPMAAIAAPVGYLVLLSSPADSELR